MAAIGALPSSPLTLASRRRQRLPWASGLAPRSLNLRQGAAVRSLLAPSRQITTIEEIEADHPELLNITSEDLSAKFSQYRQATSSIDTLNTASRELQAFLESLSLLDSELDERLLAVPPAPEDAAAARRTRRASKRAARTTTPPTTVHAAAAPLAPSPAASIQLQAAVVVPENDRVMLEELFRQTSAPEGASPSEAPSAVAAAPMLKPKVKLHASRAAAMSAPPAAAVVQALPARVARPEPEMLLVSQAVVASPMAPELDVVEAEEAEGPSLDELQRLEVELHADMAAIQQQTAQQQIEQLEQETVQLLESSALVTRGPQQTSIMPVGPSILALVGGEGALGKTSAKSRHARRSAAYAPVSASRAHERETVPSVKAPKINKADGISSFLAGADIGLLGDQEEAVTRMTQDYLWLERLREEMAKALGRSPTLDETAQLVEMHPTAFVMRLKAAEQAKSRLMRSNYRLVMSICKKYLGKGAQLQDLMSEGIKGLLKGVEKYDPSKGFKFSTYAHWWIRQAISRSLAEQTRAVRLPVHMIEAITKMRLARAELADKLQREPSHQEVCDSLGMSFKRYMELFRTSTTTTSLDVQLSDDGNGSTLKDMIEDHRGDASDELTASQLGRDVEAILDACLLGREAEIVRLRFGLVDEREWTLEEIGERMQVTRERVRQVEGKALRKMKAYKAEMTSKLGEYAEHLDLMEDKDLAARTSRGTKKT